MVSLDMKNKAANHVAVIDYLVDLSSIILTEMSRIRGESAKQQTYRYAKTAAIVAEMIKVRMVNEMPLPTPRKD